MGMMVPKTTVIVALRNEKGSYNYVVPTIHQQFIVALRNEKGSYNTEIYVVFILRIVALRNEKGSYNFMPLLLAV